MRFVTANFLDQTQGIEKESRGADIWSLTFATVPARADMWTDHCTVPPYVRYWFVNAVRTAGSVGTGHQGHQWRISGQPGDLS